MKNIVSTDVCDGGEHITLTYEDGTKEQVTRTDLTTKEELGQRMLYKENLISCAEVIRQTDLEKLVKGSQ